MRIGSEYALFGLQTIHPITKEGIGAGFAGGGLLRMSLPSTTLFPGQTFVTAQKGTKMLTCFRRIGRVTTVRVVRLSTHRNQANTLPI